MACGNAIRSSRRVIKRWYAYILFWILGQIADPVLDCDHGNGVLRMTDHALRRLFGNCLRFWEHCKEAEARDGGAGGDRERRL